MNYGILKNLILTSFASAAFISNAYAEDLQLICSANGQNYVFRFEDPVRGSKDWFMMRDKVGQSLQPWRLNLDIKKYAKDEIAFRLEPPSQEYFTSIGGYPVTTSSLSVEIDRISGAMNITAVGILFVMQPAPKNSTNADGTKKSFEGATRTEKELGSVKGTCLKSANPI